MFHNHGLRFLLVSLKFLIMGAFLEYLLDAIFLFAMLRMAYSALRHLLASKPASQPAPGRGTAAPGPQVKSEMARDPECGMFVSTEVSRRLRWKGEVFHFCSQECLEKYQSRAQAS